MLRWCSPGSWLDTSPTDVAISPDGAHLYVTGTANKYSVDPIATIAYDALGGGREWLRTIAPLPGDSYPSPRVAVSPDGGTVVVGAKSYRSGIGTFFTASYTSSGSANWSATDDDPDDVATLYGLAIDVKGSIYVTGQGKNVGTALGSLTVVYAPTGGPPTWEVFLPPQDVGDGVSFLVVAPDASRVFVTTRINKDIRTDAYLTS